MAEPVLSVSGVTALTLAAAGYISGDYTSILLGSIAGSFWPLGGAATESRRKGLWLLVKLVMTALALSGFVAHLLEHYHAVPSASLVMGPVAFFIAVFGDKWLKVFDSVANGVVSVLDAGFKALAKRASKLLGGASDADRS